LHHRNLGLIQLSEEIISYVHFGPEGPELYSISVCHDGVTPIRDDLWAVLTAALGLVGGVVGATAIAAAVAVLTCLIAVRRA
jgi:hypothetical protein